MKTQRTKYSAAWSGILFFAAFIWLVPVASAQILKPGEIVYSRAPTSGSNCDTAAIWAVGQDGSNDRFITLGMFPRISPDGRFILFQRFRPNESCIPFGNGAPIFWLRDIAAGQETQISQNSAVSFGHFFSPETNRADRQIMFDDGTAICTMNPDGTNRNCLVGNLGQLVPMRFAKHPSVRGGDNLVAIADHENNSQPDGGIYTLNYDTLGNRQKIPNTSFGDLSPSWSNDGQTIAHAFLPSIGGRTQPYFFTDLFKIQSDGSNRTQLTTVNTQPGEGFSYSLVWTLDNQTILNAARINGLTGIHRIAVDGSGILGVIPITAGAEPQWVGGIAPVYSEQQTASFGGGSTSGGSFMLVDTVGQGFAGQTSVGGNYSLDSGFWTLPASGAGIEGDIAPRPNGDGSVLANDVLLIRRFFSGTSTPDPTTNEFQRADCAPRSTSGDGMITAADIIQARRYQNGLDPLQNAGGPTEDGGGFAPPVAASSEKTDSVDQTESRELRIQSVNATAGQTVTVNIRVDAVGDEAGYGFRLNYNNTKLLHPVIGAGNAGAAARSCAERTYGLNCAVDTFPNNQPGSSDPSIGEIAPGNDQILMTVTFTVAPNLSAGPIPLSLTNVNASNDNADLFIPNAVNGTVNVSGPTAAGVSLSGRVLTADGRGLRNAVVVLTDRNGVSRRALSSSFGYYRFDDVQAGEMYVVSVTSKRYQFTPHVVSVTNEITGLDFVADAEQ